MAKKSEYGTCCDCGRQDYISFFITKAGSQNPQCPDCRSKNIAKALKNRICMGCLAVTASHQGTLSGDDLARNKTCQNCHGRHGWSPTDEAQLPDTVLVS